MPDILFRIFRLLTVSYIIDRLKHVGLGIPKPPISFGVSSIFPTSIVITFSI